MVTFLIKFKLQPLYFNYLIITNPMKRKRSGLVTNFGRHK